MYARDHALIATPIGMVRLPGTPETIETVRIEPGICDAVAGRGALAGGPAQVAAYFAKRLRRFDLPLALPAPPHEVRCRGRR